jgi:hypothetical protein
VIAGNQTTPCNLPGEHHGFRVVGIARVETRDKERGIDEDQGSGFDGP